MWRTAALALASLAAGAAGAVCVAARWTPPGDGPVPEWTRLPNGLQFRVQRIREAKHVGIVTVYGVGSDHDPAGKAGLAHLAEHLYATSAAGDEPARTVEQCLDRYDQMWNAQTLATSTCAWMVVGPGRVERELTEIAARMSDLRIDQSSLDYERPRVLEQIGAHDDSPSAVVEARSVARARIHPVPNAGRPGGTAAEVEGLTLDDVRAFARRYYRPANARIAVAGDVDSAAVAALITRIFADLPAGEPGPEAPRADPIFGDVRIDAGPAPGPGYEPQQCVYLAYAYCVADDQTRAVIAALGNWGPPKDAPSDAFLIQATECSIDAAAIRGERTADEVTRAFDARIDDFVQHATGPVAAERIREAIRKMREFAETMRDAGIPVPVAQDEERLATIGAAFRLALPGTDFRSSDSLLAAVERLSNDDIRRSVAKWHVAERRVVVDWHGWRKKEPSDAPPDVDRVPEVRIMMTWDEATQTVHRNIDGVEYAKDDALASAVKAVHATLVDDGKPDAPVTIDADPRIAWSEVTAVVNLIKRCGIEKIEFATGAPPKRDDTK